MKPGKIREVWWALPPGQGRDPEGLAVEVPAEPGGGSALPAKERCLVPRSPGRLLGGLWASTCPSSPSPPYSLGKAHPQHPKLCVYARSTQFTHVEELDERNQGPSCSVTGPVAAPVFNL